MNESGASGLPTTLLPTVVNAGLDNNFKTPYLQVFCCQLATIAAHAFYQQLYQQMWHQDCHQGHLPGKVLHAIFNTVVNCS